jgi:hypothetical protein
LKLLCPLTMERVNVPVRGEHCQHLQCFSLEAFLVSNYKMSAFNSRWVCPVCSLILRPNDLRIDTFVEAVLANTPQDEEEVAIMADGTWRCSATDARSHGMVTPQVNSADSGTVATFFDAVELVDDVDVALVAPHANDSAHSRSTIPFCDAVDVDDDVDEDNVALSMLLTRREVPTPDMATPHSPPNAEVVPSISNSKWSCPQCTLFNTVAASKCKVCDAPNPQRIVGVRQKRPIPVASPLRHNLAHAKRVRQRAH